MTDATTPRTGVKRFIGIDWNLGALKVAGPRYWAFVSLLVCGLALGLMAWGTALTNGGAVMGMRDTYPWGLWFVDYMYYIGLAAGGLIVYASVHLFGAEQFRPLSRIAVLQAGVFVMMALLGIITDMERPWRAIWMLITPNPTSPFVYTGSAAGIYMVIAFVDLWVLLSGKGGEKLAFRLTLVALPLAIYMHTTTAFVLSMNKSRDLWHSAMLVPIFLSSAIASGVALLLIFAYIMQATKVMKFKSSMFRSLSTLLATVMVIDLFFLVVEILSVFWPTSSQPGEALRMGQFLWGQYAWAFLPVLVLGISAFVLLSRRKTRHLPAVQITASVMYVIAVAFKRYSLMAMGFSITSLGQATKTFAPSPVEIGLAVGILSLGILMITLSAKVLPLTVPEEEHGHALPEEAAAGSRVNVATTATLETVEAAVEPEAAQ